MLHFKISLKTEPHRCPREGNSLSFWIALKLLHIPRIDIIQWHHGLKSVWALNCIHCYTGSKPVSESLAWPRNYNLKKPIKQSQKCDVLLLKSDCALPDSLISVGLISSPWYTSVCISFKLCSGKITSSIATQEWNNALTFSPFQVQQEHGYFSLTCFERKH